jgi:hypothetical protein
VAEPPGAVGPAGVDAAGPGADPREYISPVTGNITNTVSQILFRNWKYIPQVLTQIKCFAFNRLSSKALFLKYLHMNTAFCEHQISLIIHYRTDLTS